MPSADGRTIQRRGCELKAKRRKERIDGLLAQAAALRQARDILAYVAEVRAEAAAAQVTAEQLDRWAAWALSTTRVTRSYGATS